jgi:predicted metal-dependent phosphoesterase TrpH
MLHDLNVKTNFSYGTQSPEQTLHMFHVMGVDTLSFTDAFSIGQNLAVQDMGNIPHGMNYLNGSEWFTRLDGRGFGRVDLLFVGFDITDALRAWVFRELKLITYKWDKGMPSNMNLEQSWTNKYEFARLVAIRGLKRAYFDTLPATENVIKKFVRAGGKIFLSDLPFTNNFGTKCRIVKQLKELGLSGMVVFKDKSKYLDPETEIQQSLDLCRYADLMPVVGSGICSDYSKRSVVYEEAKKSFAYLTKQLLQMVA